MKAKILVLIIISFISIEMAFSQTATEILKKTDEAVYGPKDQSSQVKIVLVDKRGGTQERDAIYLQKGSEMRLFKFTSPASQRGIAFLSLPDDVMYIYLPAYEKERRIASHIKNQSFAGTDFTYDDMESKPMSDKYDATMMGETADTWTLKLTPKAGTESDYSRMEMVVRKDNYYMSNIDYYDLGGQKIKELVNTKIEKIGKYWAAVEMQMTDLVKDHKTIFISNNLVFDSNLSDDEFTVRKMKQ